MRKHLRLLGVLALALAFAAGTALPALGSSGDVSRLAGLHAQARNEHGLSSLPAVADLARDAQRHAQDMAARGEIYHSGRTSDLQGWSALGENVGYAGTVDEVFSLFMDSPSHRSNILDAGWDSIGIGVASGDDGSIYASVLFGTRSQRPAPPAEAPAKPKPATKQPKVRSPERVTIVPSPSPAPSGRSNPVPAPAVPLRPLPKPPSPDPLPAAPPPRDASRALGVLLSVEREFEPLPESEEASAIGGVSADAARDRFEQSETERRRQAEQSEPGAAARTLGQAARCAWRGC